MSPNEALTKWHNFSIGFNQQQPDLANVGPQIPEQAAANPNEDMNDMFEFALNNSILDLDSLETTP
uniref:Uncharacterized protein n=1 Tax=Oryza brachyantha TaxID=4533 RepID=J3MQY8_ORYBR